MVLKDKEKLKKEVESKERELSTISKREEDLQGKMDEIQKQMRERELIAEKKTEDNFNLK